MQLEKYATSNGITKVQEIMEYKKTAEIFMTYGQGGWDQRVHQTVLFGLGETENKVINLYPEVTYQVFDGFGGAITEAAGYVYSLMDEGQKRQLMEAYFAPNRMNYQFIRIPIDSCDFSLGQYEASAKSDFSDFSFARVEKYILPMLDDAEQAAGRKLQIILSPWSPPAYMKTNGRRSFGGKLKEEWWATWAEYLCRYIHEYRKRGYRVVGLTLQNEAKAVQTWDSCIFTAAEQKAFLREHMYPALIRSGLADLEIYIWDHNKERVYEWMRDIIDEETDKMVAGAAVHWYSGDHFDALALCKEKFPSKKLIVSESCIEHYKFDASDVAGTALKLAHEVVGDLNHGISAFIDWNILLDEKGGPNYVQNYCAAPFFYDTQCKKLHPHLISKYYEHFSSTIVPGSVRIAISQYSETIDITAWLRPDASIAVVILNRASEIKSICLRLEDKEAEFVMYPESIATAIIR